MPDEEIERIKDKLKDYSEADITFNEPHFTNQLILRGGRRDEAIKFILAPDKLVYVSSEQDSYGSIRHCLYYEVSGSRTMKLPVIFDKGGKKGLYMLTYIMRYRKWQGMIGGKGR